jgi:diguanylate cyclase (GGDEF)-like protein/PAS domain S-box-containing protein
MNDRTPHGSTALEARLEELVPGLDLVGLPVCVLDVQRRYRHVNPAYCAFTARKREDFLGKEPDQVYSAVPVDGRRKQLQRAFEGETVVFNRQNLEGPNAGKWVRAHYMPLREAGEVVGVMVVLVDVQELKEAEEALAQQRRQMKLVLDNIGVPMSYIDRGMRFRFANQPGFDWVVADPSKAIGKRVDEMFDEEVMKVIRPEIEAALKGQKRTYERVATIEGGAKRWVRVHLVPDVAQDGSVQGIYSLMLDVDQDHRMRQALEEQESKLRTFAQNIPGPIAMVDKEFRYVFANKYFEQLRSMSADQLIGRSVREVIGEEFAVKYFDPFVEPLKRGESCSYERLVGPPGRQRWHIVRLNPIMDAEGAFNGYYIVGSDIHDIKLAQERLAAQEEQVRLFTDNIPDAVAYLNRERRILFANRHFAQMRGSTPDKIIGLTTPQLLGADMAAWIKERTQRVFDLGETATYERVAELPDGQLRHFHVKAVPDFDHGVVRGMYVVAHDITEVKEAQERLAEREKDLRFFAENIPEAIVYIDLKLGCTFVNNVFLATRGFSREFALGKFPRDVYPPALVEELQPHIDRAITGQAGSYERQLHFHPGSGRWVRVSITPRIGDDGQVIGYYVVSTDIHDIKVAQAAIEDKERQLRQVIDSIPTPMCFVDAEGRYRYLNDAFVEYVGRPAEEVVGQSVRDILGEDRWLLLEPVVARVRAGESLSVERLVRFANGRARWMTVRLSPRFRDGEYMGYYATTSDIHEQKMVEQELRRTNTILSAHFDNTPLAVMEWDTQMRIVRWSGQAEAIFGWSAPEALGRSLAGWRLVYEEDEAAVQEMVRGLFEGQERHATILNRNYRKDGSVIWVEWHNSSLRDESGRVISILSLAQDVSSRIQAEERLQFMATHDGLTALPNSVLLNDRLDSSIARAQRAKARVAVMFLDLDHFKDVNDTLGHRVGDLLLKEVSRRIRAALRQSDVLARISGDEFVIVLEDLHDEDAPDHVARKILEEVRRPFQIEGNEIHVSGSLGLALYPEDGEDAETLLKNADAAMYHAKELGRDGLRTFSRELGERRAHRMKMEAALRRALKENELRLHFQPIMDIASGKIGRAEALLRWHDPQLGMVLPAGFIPLAEETGLGHALGHWVIDHASRQAREWRDRGLGDIVVCVNLSASQLRDSTLVADLKRTLGKNGCEPGWLQFEITETSMVRDVEGASLVLAKLRGLGVRIAIDDFGTGFSSLSHLRHLPVDVLKVDKAFVADIETHAGKAGEPGRGDVAGGAAIVSAVIGLARGLGLDVVAEGVERQGQLDFLQREGCRACQGYLICPPLPADEFENWLRKRHEATKAKAKTKAKPKAKKRATSLSKPGPRPAANRKSALRRRATRQRS